jgi:L-ornithine Nalpha-acyltransferase
MIVTPTQLQLKLATKKEEIEQALRLRYQVFIEEAGNTKYFNEYKMETDIFDPYCDHLIVTNLASDEVVGTYRLLPGQRVKDHINFYSEIFIITGCLHKNIIA